jgi:hypothetical protein
MKSLSPHDIQILLALWLDLYGPRHTQTGSPRRSGLTREELCRILVDRPTLGQTGVAIFKTAASINKHLTALKQLNKLVLTDQVPAHTQTGTGAGHFRDRYSLAEGKAITWATTAKIVIEVWSSAGHHINEEILINRVASLQLEREPGTAPLSRGEILADINFAVSKKYLNRYERDLRADQRLYFEIDYITAIAAFCITGEGKSRLPMVSP